jgi:xanthine/CO dehydrogenase XdhC/CoxF family maturation factor
VDSCDVAHGGEPPPAEVKTLVVVFDSAVGKYLVRYGEDLGYRTVLVNSVDDMPDLDGGADVVVTDHHRPDLGEALKSALAGSPRWIGLMGNPRHPGPHVEALTALGVSDENIARVHRPIGLNIGSRTPAEIAIATLAGLVADRNGKPGGFAF